MPLILRKLRKKSSWESRGITWLGPGQLQADVFGDLATKQNMLSVYKVGDNTRSDTLDRVIAALAVAGTEHISDKFEYLLFDESILQTLGIKIAHNKGETPDLEVDALHIDLIELSADRLLSLAVAMSGGTKERRLKKEVRTLVAQGILKGHIERSKLKLNVSELSRIDLEIRSLSGAVAEMSPVVEHLPPQKGRVARLLESFRSKLRMRR